MKTFFLFFCVLLTCSISAQVGVSDETSGFSGGNAIDPKAVLEVRSTSKGLLLPRMNSSQIDDLDGDMSSDPNTGLTPGMIVYNSETKTFLGWDGTRWQNLSFEGTASNTTTVQFVNTTSTLVENGSLIAIELSISDASATTATTVEIALDNSSTATNGTDFDNGASTPAAISFPVTVTFPAGSSANQTVTIYISNDDTDAEGDETVVLNLQNPSGGNNSVLGTNTTHTLTITDNDTPQTNLVANGGFENWTGSTPDSWTTIDSGITLSEETTTVNEGSSAMRVNVTTASQGDTDFRQNINVVAGTVYNVSVDVYQLNSDVEARLYVDGYRGYSDSNNTNSWQSITYTYTAASTGTAEIGLRFYDQESSFNGSAEILIDNFTVTAQ